MIDRWIICDLYSVPAGEKADIARHLVPPQFHRSACFADGNVERHEHDDGFVERFSIE